MRLIVLAFVLSLAAPRAVCAYGVIPPAVDQALRAGGIPLESVSILLQEAAAERPVLSINAERPMNPASVMKLLTTYAGLEMLGPAFTWTTDAFVSAPVRDGVLEGDLLIRESTGDRLVIEAKNVKAMDLAGWVKEAEVEAKNYAEHRGIYQPDFAVVHKRRGKGAADAYVTMPLREYMRQRMAPPF